MRKHLKYGFFVCVLGTAIVLALLYYGTRNNAEQSDLHTIPSDLSSVPSSSDNVSEAVQSEEAQVSVEKESLEHSEDRQVKQEHRIQPDATAENSSGTVLEGRKVTLEDGTEIVVVDVPDSLMKKTKVRFDEEGKAHVSCH